MPDTDKAKARKILEERDEAQKGFKPREGGDPFEDKNSLLRRDDEGEKQVKERQAAAKGLKPKEGGDPLNSEKHDDEKVADGGLALGLGLRR